MTKDAFSDLLIQANRVFTPGAPINRRDLFRGRISQVARVFETVPSPGRHPIIFGQRGVGKTSLANILSELFPDFWSVKVSCDSSDSFETIWDRILRKTSISFRKRAFGFSDQESVERSSLRAFISDDQKVTPSAITDVLGMIQSSTVLILDEFDRVSDPAAKTAMADLIKNLSDNIHSVTIVLVGVGHSIKDMIGEHPSIQRNLSQIEMPPMSPDEIKEILASGCNELNLQLEAAIAIEVAILANGFPHFAHLLGLSIAKTCVLLQTIQLNLQQFQTYACPTAVDDAIEIYRDAYSSAVRTSKSSRYPQILCACAHAKYDDQGVFRATDVVGAVADIFGERVTVQSVVPALGEFCQPNRGPILEKVRLGSRNNYRFRDPMMRPFLRIKSKTLTRSILR